MITWSFKFLDILSRPGGSQPIAMSDEGEGVDHIKVIVTAEAKVGVFEKLRLGLTEEHMDHDGVKLRINIS